METEINKGEKMENSKLSEQEVRGKLKLYFIEKGNMLKNKSKKTLWMIAYGFVIVFSFVFTWFVSLYNKLKSFKVKSILKFLKRIDKIGFLSQILMVAMLLIFFGLGMAVSAYLEGPKDVFQILSALFVLNGIGIIIVCQLLFLYYRNGEEES